MVDIGDITLIKLWWEGNRWHALGYSVCEHDKECLIPTESGDSNHFMIELNAYDISQECDLVIALKDAYYNCDKVQVDPVGYYNASI